MKHALIFALLLALLAPAALADNGRAWETATDIFMGQLNDDIQRNDSDAHLYTDIEVTPGMSLTAYGPDGCFAMVYANDDESVITGIDLFCEDAGCVRRRLDDVAYLAYCFGSRDSVQAVSDWCDQWHDAMRDAVARQRELEADPCECAAFAASMRVYQNDAQTYWLRIHLDIFG